MRQVEICVNRTISYHYIHVHDVHIFVTILSFCQINVMKTNAYNSCGVITTLDM